LALICDFSIENRLREGAVGFLCFLAKGAILWLLGQRLNGRDDFAPYESKRKDNVIGYIRSEVPVILKHPEHQNVLLPAGCFEVRHCRSWEAQPQAVWTAWYD